MATLLSSLAKSSIIKSTDFFSLIRDQTKQQVLLIRGFFEGGKEKQLWDHFPVAAVLVFSSLSLVKVLISYKNSQSARNVLSGQTLFSGFYILQD